MTDSLENHVQVALSEEAKPGKGPLEAKEACLTGEARFKPVEGEMEDMVSAPGAQQSSGLKIQLPSQLCHLRRGHY